MIVSATDFFKSWKEAVIASRLIINTPVTLLLRFGVSPRIIALMRLFIKLRFTALGHTLPDITKMKRFFGKILLLGGAKL